MGDVLAELEDVLRSHPTPDKKHAAQEEMVLQLSKAKAIQNFILATCTTSALVWTASRRLTQGQRFNLSVGSGIFAGMWLFGKSLDASLDHILGLEGSRMQREAANIILTRHQDDASRVKLVHKRFYAEKVFSDINPDTPFFRWRSRNSYMEKTATPSRDTADSSFHEKPDVKQKKPTGSPAEDATVDPLDFIFGSPESSREITHSDRGTMPRRRLHARKRAHRRHRAHSTETDTDR